MADDKWLSKARNAMARKKPSTVGLFGRKAAAAGKSTQEYAHEKYSAPGVLGKEARFAANAGGKR